MDSSSKMSLDIELTNKTVSKTIQNHQAEIRFVSEVFPACAGLGPNWNYEYHNQFSVNVGEKHTLLLKGSKVSLEKIYLAKVACSVINFSYMCLNELMKMMIL